MKNILENFSLTLTYDKENFQMAHNINQASYAFLKTFLWFDLSKIKSMTKLIYYGLKKILKEILYIAITFYLERPP